MWQGQQPPGGEQNPQDRNPYQQPGYQAPNPYQQPSAYQQQGQQNAQYMMPGMPQQAGGGGGEGGGGRGTKVIAIVAATAVVVAAGITGFLVLGSDKDDEKPAAASRKPSGANHSPEASSTEGGDDARGNDGGEKPTVKGWKTVVNPKHKTVFDVPPDWEVKSPDSAVAFEDVKTGEPLFTMSAPAYYKSQWCSSDDDKDGRSEDKALSAVGTKGARGAKNTSEVALNTVWWWIYAPYAQPDKKSVIADEKAKPYTTKSGVKGSIAWARSKNAPQRSKCDSEGKAITFGFKNSEGDYVAWSLYSAAGVKEEVPDATIMKILSTVRLPAEGAAAS
ncbi:hypothetical protein [Streptomyces sp. NPDC051218]|uniref:hypothetical protein n=1 Tax=Streptomyces sp. NPDC051218 TaxID=3365645 RepID=UPI0037930EAC